MAEGKKDPKLGAILLGMPKGMSKGKSMGEDEDMSEGARALSDCYDAMNSGDFEGAYEAFERAVALCKDPGAYETKPEEEAG